MSKDKAAPDPFPHLPRRSFYGDTVNNPQPPIVPVKEQKIAADASPKKRGRPKAEGPKPWEAEGVTQRTWYRRRKDRTE